MNPNDIIALAVIARPGDTILIGFERPLTDEDIEAMDENFRPIIDEGIKVGYLDSVTSMVVVRPGGEVT